MITTIIFIVVIVLVLFLLVKGTIKNRRKQASKLSIFEHPSTFEKPNIEMVENRKENTQLPKIKGS